MSSLVIKTEPAVEPVSLVEAKSHLKLSSEALEYNLAVLSSIVPAAHAIAASYSNKGTGVEVSGYETLVYLVSGTNGAGGTVDAKIQESETDVDANYTDWTGGAFTQVTESNDNAVQEKAYTGTCRYIRVVATIAVAACAFGAMVMRKSGPTSEDTELTIYIKSARRNAEWVKTWRAFITQTLEYWLDSFPNVDSVRMPMPPLQSVSSIKYYDVDNVEYTIAATEYYVDTKDQFGGWVTLNDSKSWPTTTLRPANGVCITFVAGYGDAGSDVPADIRHAILLMVTDAYENRGDIVTGTISSNLKRADNLLMPWRAY